jgi:phosphotransferase system HPr (HPr) family protein
MARRPRIKQPLIVNGVEVRDIEMLRDNFDVDALIGYAFDGKLAKWLRDRYYDDEADEIDSLEQDDPDLEDKLYDIFQVDPPMSEEEIAWRNERLAKLKEYTTDEEILDRVDDVAFDQQDLSDLIDDDVEEIYLCGGRFTIPLKVENKTYIGIGDAVAVIRSNVPIDFDDLNIHFKDIRFNSAYEKISPQADDGEPADSLYDRGMAALRAKDYSEARKLLERAAMKNHREAIKEIAAIYSEGKGMKPNPEKAFKWLLKAAEQGSKSSMNKVASMYERGTGVKKDIEKALYWYRASAKMAAEEPAATAPAPTPQAAVAPPPPTPVVEDSKPSVSHNEILIEGNTARVTTKVINKTGVHSHPAYNFVQTAGKYKSKIQILAKGRKCDGKSILMVMSLGLAYGTEMTIYAEGPDAPAAVETLRDLVDDGFGEE